MKNLRKWDKPKGNLVFPIVVLSLLGFAIFGNSLGGDFVYDDHLVLSHELFSDPARVLNFVAEPYFDDFPQGGLYRPLTQASFSFNFLVSRSPLGFHLLNLLLHISNSLLVFYLVRVLSGSGRLSWVSSLLFIVLPIHAEAVSSIIGRAELLVFFFSILSTIFYLRQRYFLSVVLFLGALLSKETAIVLPFILAVTSPGSLLKEYKKKIIYLASFVGGYFILRWLALGEFTFKPEVEYVFNPLSHEDLPVRVFTGLKVLSLYIYNIFWPVSLSPDYSFNQIKLAYDPLSLPVIFGAFILGLVVFYICKASKVRGPNLLRFGLTAFLFPYLLVSNFLVATGTIMADRLMYLPSLGAVILAALYFERLSKEVYKNMLPWVFIFLICVYSWFTVKQNTIWANSETLFINMYERSPHSVVAQYNFAKMVAERDINLAKDIALKAHGQYEDFVPNLNLLGHIAKSETSYKEAEEYLGQALVLSPKNQETLTLLARVFYLSGNFEDAAEKSGLLVENYRGAGNIIIYIMSVIRSGNYSFASDILNKYRQDLDAEAADFFNSYLEFKLGKRVSNIRQLELKSKSFEKGI